MKMDDGSWHIYSSNIAARRRLRGGNSSDYGISQRRNSWMSPPRSQASGMRTELEEPSAVQLIDTRFRRKKSKLQKEICCIYRMVVILAPPKQSIWPLELWKSKNV